jgi:hypothetical protein
MIERRAALPRACAILPTESRDPMTRTRGVVAAASLAAALTVTAAGSAEETASAAGAALGSRALAQMRALLAAKEQRSPLERKLGFQLLAGLQEANGTVPAGAPAHLRSATRPDPDGTVLVDIRGLGTKALVNLVRKVGGNTMYVAAGPDVVRARVPFSAIEAIAASGLVRSVRPSAKPMVAGAPLGRPDPAKAEVLATLRPGFERRAGQVRASLADVLAAGRGRIVSEGVAAHQADKAQDLYGATGAGVKVGVLSDSVKYLAEVQADGELPAVTVLQDIAPGSFSYGEGTAMLEIVHDMAPAAELFFASAANGEQSFADNIRALREAGCDIIVDDVSYSDEPPFQDGPIAAAVNDVTRSGALYFSAAGNQGNLDDGTSSVWEGSFKPATGVVYQPLTSLGYTLHDFGTDNVSDLVLTNGQDSTVLFWSEPLGAAKADYDLFVTDINLQEIVDASANVQDGGGGDPFETLGSLTAGERLIVAKKAKAAVKRIHLNTLGARLGIRTAGQAHGHSAAASAISVAAVDAAVAQGGPFTGGQQNPVEHFSADGPRQIFFNALGKPAAALLRKPNIAAADAVTVDTPLYSPFLETLPFQGTSAAAAHAAGVAALLRSVLPKATPATIRNLLTTTALDIERYGPDRDSGVGLVMAVNAMEKARVKPMVNLQFSEAGALGGSPDGDPYVEPGESAFLFMGLSNVGGVGATDVSGTLTTATPGVSVTTPTASYPKLPPGASANNFFSPFAFSLDAGAPCGLKVESQVDVTYAGGSEPKSFHFNVQTGQPSATQVETSFTGPPVPVPYGDPTGVDIPIQVSGLTRVADLNFSFDGPSCGSLAFGLIHGWVGGLIVTLKSPQGTTVTLMKRPGGSGNYGYGFCGTVLDDDGGGPSIDTIRPEDTPYTGTYRPHQPLSAFDGEDPNGTWVLNVSDHDPLDTGSVSAFTLTFTGFDCH